MKNLLNFIFAIFAVMLSANAISTVAFEGQFMAETAIGLTALSAIVGSLVPAGALGVNIAVNDSQGLYTKKLVASYRELVSTTSFLRSFFPSVEHMTKEISIAVKRGSEYVAVDVARYSDGNRNTFDKSSEKIMIPPLYHEYLSVNEHRLYDQVIMGLSQGNTTFFRELVAEQAIDLMELQKKIERSIELQCAQVLETGVVSLDAVTDIDFQRKAASLVAYNVANDFSVGTVDPYAVLKAGATFIRTKGKSQGSVYNVIMGDTVLTDFLNNTIVKARADIRNFTLDQVREPQKDATGGVLHGEVSAGAYKFRIWSYPEYYDTISALNNPYMNDKKLVIIPDNPNFKTAFAAVPQLIGENGTIPQKGAYLTQDFRDEKAASHEQHIKSAPIAIPVAIDQIYTIQVVAP